MKQATTSYFATLVALKTVLSETMPGREYVDMWTLWDALPGSPRRISAL